MSNTVSPPGIHTTSTGPQGTNIWMRGVNVVLGAWLFISAFIWPHTPESRTNTWILGVIIAVVGALGTAAPAVRWVNTAAAIWLFFSTFWIRHISTGTVWNNAIVAVVVFLVSLAGNSRLSRTTLR